jgi:hypothetical protein
MIHLKDRVSTVGDPNLDPDDGSLAEFISDWHSMEEYFVFLIVRGGFGRIVPQLEQESSPCEQPEYGTYPPYQATQVSSTPHSPPQTQDLHPTTRDLQVRSRHERGRTIECDLSSILPLEGFSEPGFLHCHLCRLGTVRGWRGVTHAGRVIITHNFGAEGGKVGMSTFDGDHGWS